MRVDALESSPGQIKALPRHITGSNAEQNALQEAAEYELAQRLLLDGEDEKRTHTHTCRGVNI